MRGILYFSATGNSLYVAQRLQERLDGRICYIPTYTGDGTDFDDIIIVSPVYSFGLPVHVYDLIPRLSKTVPIWIVLNYGGMSGGADRFAWDRCKEQGLSVRGVYLVKMPENYTLTFSVPEFYKKSLLNAAPRAIDAIAAKISAGEARIPANKKSKEAYYLKNRPNWHLITQDFSVTEDCIRCGKCVDLCPSDNISLVDGKVVFADRCVICLGCYHRCPQKAIRYKGKTKSDRYLNPNIRESDIGKDF